MRALTRRSAAAAVAGVLVLTGAAACGSSKKKADTGNPSTSGQTKKDVKADPQKAFTDALAKLGSSKGGTVTIKFDATESQITAFATASEKAAGKTFSAQDAQIAKYLSTGSITIESADKAESFELNLNGQPLLQFAGAATGDVYFRADVPAIAKLAGPSAQAEVGQIGPSLASNPSFSFLTDAIAGKWLEIDGASLKQVEALAQSQLGAAAAAASPSAGEVKELQAKLATALAADFTATDAGTDPKGEHLVLTGNVKKLAADLVDVVKDLPGAGAALTKVDTASVPDKDVKVDAYVGDDGVNALSLNLAQFSSDPTAAGLSFPLEVAFSAPPSSISIPPSATKVDVSKLLSSLGSLGLGKG